MHPSTISRRPAPPTARAVRAAMAIRSTQPRIRVLQLAEANLAARQLGGCLGCVQGTTVAIGVSDPSTGNLVCLAVCATPSDTRFADPHTLELKCLLTADAREEHVRRLLRGVEQHLSAKGYRRIVRRTAAGSTPTLDVTGWTQAAACGWRNCDGRTGPGVVWSKVLRGDLH